MLYYKEFVEPIQGQAWVYSFDRLPDGSFSEIKLVSINRIFDKVAHMNNPGLGEFVPGMPYGILLLKIRILKRDATSAERQMKLSMIMFMHRGSG